MKRSIGKKKANRKGKMVTSNNTNFGILAVILADIHGGNRDNEEWCTIA